MPVIKFDLSAEGISRALEELKVYGESVKSLDERVVKRLAKDGAENARQLVAYMDAIDTGELSGSIIDEVSDKTGYVKATAPHAAYVEFGTGVVGAGAPHPAPIGWAYDVNGHGEAGWMYPGDDGKWHWTKGMASRPYMYDTAQMMAQAVPQIVEEELQS